MTAVGASEGELDGGIDGRTDGDDDGVSEGSSLGATDGPSEGAVEGKLEGRKLGICDGFSVGLGEEGTRRTTEHVTTISVRRTEPDIIAFFIRRRLWIELEAVVVLDDRACRSRISSSKSVELSALSTFEKSPIFSGLAGEWEKC